ncbi:MAG: cobalamin biosynthesis protein [Albidovulum sp.]|nr:cobalamin biosynthesis protein [Albidovulum sp.]
MSPFEVGAICSIDLKEDEAAIHALAGDLGVPARFYTADRLESETPRLKNPSEAVFNEVGCHGVSEAAALAAAGPDGWLEVEKRKSRF